MSKKSIETKREILQATLAILRESGADGVTMRKVAALCERNLNNIQYYYKNKSALLAGLASYYFEECTDFIDNFVPSSDDISPKESLYEAILYGLDYSSQLSDVCIVFRELWAMSSRNKEIESQLQDYYQQAISKVSSIFGDYEQDRCLLAASILVPYFDGYSLQHKSLPMDMETIAETLTHCIYTILSESNNA